MSTSSSAHIITESSTGTQANEQTTTQLNQITSSATPISETVNTTKQPTNQPSTIITTEMLEPSTTTSRQTERDKFMVSQNNLIIINLYILNFKQKLT